MTYWIWYTSNNFPELKVHCGARITAESPEEAERILQARYAEFGDTIKTIGAIECENDRTQWSPEYRKWRDFADKKWAAVLIEAYKQAGPRFL